jgi:hypothetical protein
MARARSTSSRPRRRNVQDGLHAYCSSAHRTTAARKSWSSCSPSPMWILRKPSGCVASPCTAALASSRSKGVRTSACACATCPGLTPPCADIFLALATSVTDVGNTRLGAATPEHVAKIDEIAFYSLTSATWDDLQAAADALPSPSSTEYADAGGSGAYAAPPPFEHPCSPLAKVRPPARSRRPAAADARRYSRRATSTSRPRRTGISLRASHTASAARRTRAASRRASCGTSTSCAGCSRSAARSHRPRAPSSTRASSSCVAARGARARARLTGADSRGPGLRGRAHARTPRAADERRAHRRDARGHLPPREDACGHAFQHAWRRRRRQRCELCRGRCLPALTWRKSSLNTGFRRRHCSAQSSTASAMCKSAGACPVRLRGTCACGR